MKCGGEASEDMVYSRVNDKTSSSFTLQRLSSNLSAG